MFDPSWGTRTCQRRCRRPNSQARGFLEAWAACDEVVKLGGGQASRSYPQNHHPSSRFERWNASEGWRDQVRPIP